MAKSLDYFQKIQLKNIILNQSTCDLKKFPTPGSKGIYSIEVTPHVHYSHKPVPKKVSDFSVTITIDFVGYEASKKVEASEDNKVFEINCKMSGYFVLTEGAEELDNLRKFPNVFASQVGPYIKEYIDYLLLKMDLTSKGIRFPLLNFELGASKAKRAPKKKKAS